MKIKSLAIFAMSGLAALSLAYVSPAIADDINDQNGPSIQAPSDAMPNGSMPNGSMPSSPTDPLDNDNGGPDAASGDDDY